MDDPKAKGSKRSGATRGQVFGITLALLLLPLLLVSFAKPLQSLAIPLQVEMVRTVEYVAEGDRQAIDGFLSDPKPPEECWREVPSGRLARVRDGVVEQFVLGTAAPVSRVPEGAAVAAELDAVSHRECWFATAQLHLVQRNPFTGEVVELTRLGPAMVSRGEMGPGLRFGVLLFVFAGAIAAVVGRRKVTSEVALAAFVAGFVQLLLWFRAAGFDAARFGGELRILGDGFEMTTAFGTFACGLATVYVLGGLGGALIGSVGVDAVTRQHACASCGHRFPSKPLPAACPACNAAVDAAASSGRTWPWRWWSRSSSSTRSSSTWARPSRSSSAACRGR